MSQRKKEDEDKGVSFAEGLRMFNTRGILVKPVRLTKKRAKRLLEIILEYRDAKHTQFDEGSKWEDYFYSALQYVKNEIEKRYPTGEKIIPVRLTKQMGLKDIVLHNKYHDEKDIDGGIALDWINNQWSKRWSIFEMQDEDNRGLPAEKKRKKHVPLQTR